MFKALRHGFNVIKAPKPFPAPVQSRLIHFPPFAGGGSVGGAGKRNRDATTSAANLEVIDLINSDDEEEQQRQRIMKFARRNTSREGNETTISAGNAPPAATNRDHSPAPTTAATMPSASEEEIARNKIMAQAAAINSERGISNSSNILLAQLHAERLARRGTTTAATPPPPSNQVDQETEPAQAPSNKLSILSYNLWFKEEVRIHSRMQAISEIISSTVVDGYPDVLCFQEVTPLIYRILSSSPWWSHYTVRPVATDLGNMSYFTVLLWKTKLSASGSGSGGDGSVSYASLPFENSQMGRDLKAVKLPTPLGFPLCVATSHIESPISNEQIFSSTRQAQCKEALEVLDIMGEDVMFIGDMNWNEENDGDPPLPPNWVDAWSTTHSDEEPGFTYDTERNPMIKYVRWVNRWRLDRAFLKSTHWKLESVELVGKEAIPNEEYKGKPVLPSDHFGLLVKLVAKPGKTLNSR